MVNYFNDFANLCFERFGNRVKHWVTFNNPWVCLQKIFLFSYMQIESLFYGILNMHMHSACLNSKYCIYAHLQSVAVEGYETGEHAPGLRVRGTGAYRAAHHIIKV